MGKLTYLNHLKACAEAAKSFTNGLVAKLAQTVTEAMQEMEDVKADKQNTKAITIPTTGWESTRTRKIIRVIATSLWRESRRKTVLTSPLRRTVRQRLSPAGCLRPTRRWRGRSAYGRRPLRPPLFPRNTG